MVLDRRRVAGHDNGLNALTMERIQNLENIIVTQQQQIDNLHGRVTGLQMDDLQRRISELQQAESDGTYTADLQDSSSGTVRQHTPTPSQAEFISSLYREKLHERAAGLDALGSSNRYNRASRRLAEKNHVNHKANIKLDKEALAYLRDENPRRVSYAKQGFDYRYDISAFEYDVFKFDDAPDEVIDALNKKSDLFRLPRFRHIVNQELKCEAIQICEWIIAEWRAWDETGEFPTDLIKNQAIRVDELMTEMVD